MSAGTSKTTCIVTAWASAQHTLDQWLDEETAFLSDLERIKRAHRDWTQAIVSRSEIPDEQKRVWELRLVRYPSAEHGVSLVQLPEIDVINLQAMPLQKPRHRCDRAPSADPPGCCRCRHRSEASPLRPSGPSSMFRAGTILC
jgi:hypothetical protein